MADSALALPAGPEPVRPRVLIVGTIFSLIAFCMAIATTMGLYWQARASVMATGEPWLPNGANLPLTPGTTGVGTLALSLITIWWAVDAVKNNDRQMAYVALGLTIFFGLAMINLTTFIYNQFNVGGDTRVGLLFYTVTGLHLAMMAAGLVFAAVMTFRTLGGNFKGQDHEGITAAALFWTVTVLVYMPIWIGIYIAK